MRILVTGGAGFIGSNLIGELLNDKKIELVRVLDNLSTGSIDNLKEYKNNPRFEFIEGDIVDFATCLLACDKIDLVSHQAALGSVPRSILDPLTTNNVNITGTLNIFTAAKEKNIRRVVYAASSSTYGDHPGLPKTEDKIGRPLSPYAVTKFVNELYANVYASLYNMEMIGLRYFNIYGPKQNPAGPYAAVIPLFVYALINNERPTINGDGSISRDFTYVKNAVDANKLALFTSNSMAINQVYNIACGERTTLLELFNHLKKEAGSSLEPIHGPQRTGDILHSLADITKASEYLGYKVKVPVSQGLAMTYRWYKDNL